MNKFKVGDKVKGIYNNEKRVVELLPGMDEYDAKYYIDSKYGMVLDNNTWVFQKDWELATRTEITWENLQKGDVIVVGVNRTKVLALLGDVFLRSLWGNFDKADNWYSITEAKSNSWTLEQPKNEEEVEEVTMSDVETKFGKKVKIVKTK